jgi:histidinol-phosphate aminotransferase
MTGTIDLHHHGDAELAPGLLDLAVNVHPGPMPSWLASAVLSACARLDIYPDARAATTAVANRHGRRPREVLLTAGAAEAFTLLAQGLPRGRAAVVHPQFTEPEVAVNAAGWDVQRIILAPGDRLRPQQIPEHCSLVVVGNPTNPTGTLHSSATLMALRRPGRVLVVDEAFMDSVPGEDVAGVVIVRSLTKTWGLAGLRIGYLLGDPAVIAACTRVQPRWSVSAPALAAAEACMSAPALQEAAARALAVTDAREYLRDQLVGRGFQLLAGSVGPFLLTRHAARPDLHAQLRRVGIAVRRADTFPGLGDGWVRVSVRDRHNNERFLESIDGLIDGRPPSEPPPATVTLIGGGLGTEGQITVAGLMALQCADVVVTDRLAPLGLLAHLREHVEIIDAAKNPRGTAMPQEKINQLLVEHARAGRNVARLKGGDPFVFGRGFEEIEACVAAGIAVTTIPGVTSAVAGPAAIGVPVTHRGITHGFTVVSGHLPPDHPDGLIDWAALARSGTTLVVLMGVATLPAIADALQAAGSPSDTPVAIVCDATRPQQRELRSTLGQVADEATTAHITPPAIAVIGAVAALGGMPS